MIEIPGHTPGSIALLDVGNRILIEGESVQDGRIYMFTDRRNIFAYIRSMEKLKQYIPCFETVYPFQGTFPVGPDLIPALIDGAKKIAHKKVQGVPTKVHSESVLLYQFPFAGFLCDIDE